MPVPPNKVKYPAVADEKSVKINNFNVGVNRNSNYGPTSTTDYWNGIQPSTSGYTVYLNKSSQGPSIYTPQNDGGLVFITNQIAGSKVANNSTDALYWFSNQNDKFVANIDYPNIVTNGLSFMVDAWCVGSYPRSGSTWKDISFSGNNATLINSPTFTLSGNGYFNFLSSSSQYTSINDLGTLTNFTCEVWGKLNSAASSGTYPCYLTNVYPGPNGNVLNYAIGYAKFPWDGKIYGGFFNAGAWRLPADGHTPTTDRWYHYAVTFDGSQILFYVDGVYFSSGTSAVGAISSGAGNRLMRRWDLGDYLNGWLANTKIYRRALSSTEILQNFHAHGLPNNYVNTNILVHLDAGNILSYYGSGTVWKDMSSKSNNGTLAVAPTYSSANKGKFTFNGSTQYITLPSNFFNHDAGTPFSVSIWFRTTNSYGIIFGQQNTSTPASASGYVPAIYVDTSGKLRTSLFWGGTTNTLVSTISVNDGLWHNVTVTFASNVQKTYIDGAFDASISRTQTNYSATYYYFLGTGESASWPSAGQDYFSGDISIFTFYTKELTSSEVAQNYQAIKNRFGY